MKLFITCAVVLITVGSFCMPNAGSWAEYTSVDDNGVMSVKTFHVAIISDMTSSDSNIKWLEMNCVKPNDAKYTFKVLLDGQMIPLRYILKEGDEPALEYWDKYNKKPLLPVWDFNNNMLPKLEADQYPENLTYLGWNYKLIQKGDSGAETKISQATRLDLDPSLMIGVWFQLRDDRTYRLYEKFDYRLLIMSQNDNLEMIKAGFNHINRVVYENEFWVKKLPVFYTREYDLHGHGVPRQFDYPEILYRSNMLGVSAFIDEPAVRFPRAAPEIFRSGLPLTDKNTPQEYAKALEAYAKLDLDESVGFGHYAFQGAIDRAATPIKRSIPLYQPDIPAWETTISASWYNVNAGASGVIEEGRWQLDRLRRFNAIMGVQIPITKENILQLDYATMRGAARVFKTNWGSSVYGQADPEIARLSVTKAYDMGARYLWFWTVDRSHHMPYDEQLNLTRLIRKHEAASPPRDMDALRNSANTAIVLPYGYTLTTETSYLFNNPFFHLSRTNPTGKTYRDVLHAAALEIERCARQNIDYDVVISDPNVWQAGYENVVEIGEDASVKINGQFVTGDRTPAERPKRTPPKLSVKLTPSKGSAPLIVKVEANVIRPKAGELGYLDKTTIIIEQILLPSGSRFVTLSDKAELRLSSPGDYLIRVIAYDDAGASSVAEKKVTVMPSKEPATGEQGERRYPRQ